jgi:hypothetical protein
MFQNTDGPNATGRFFVLGRWTMETSMVDESMNGMEGFPVENNAIQPYEEERPEAEETAIVPVAPEWPPYCNPAYIMPATIQV